MKHLRNTIAAILVIPLWLFGQGCGGDSKIKISSPVGATAVGSPFPSDIEIPSIEGLEGRAWVVSTAPPVGLYIR